MSLKERWENISQSMNTRVIRERILIAVSLWLIIYLIWDFFIYGPIAENRENLTARYEAVGTEIKRLSAEEQVFVKALANDPNVAKKREVMRLEKELESLDAELEKLAVGLIAAEKLPEVLRDVLISNNSLTLLGMQTLPVEKLQLSSGLKSQDEEEYLVDDSPQEIVGVYKHSVSVSFEGNYFSVVEYLHKLEGLQWKIYWDYLDYKVDTFPKAKITLEVFTLSTEEGMLGDKA